MVKCFADKKYLAKTSLDLARVFLSPVVSLRAWSGINIYYFYDA